MKSIIPSKYFISSIVLSMFLIGCGSSSSGSGTTDVVPTTVDSTAPIVTIQGANPVTLTQGSTYSDAGATAIDDVDGVVSVTTTGSVDTNTVGTYTITYVAVDKAGNKTEVTRTVKVDSATVADTTPPQITLYTLNPITLTQGDVYNEKGATAYDAYDGVNVTVVITGTVDTNTVGTYTITYTAVDKTGNQAQMTRTVNVIPLPADTTPPVISLIGTNPLNHIQGTDYVELGATAQDDRDGALTVAYSGTVDVTKIGTYSISYTAKDTAGNESNVTRNVNVSTFMDTTFGNSGKVTEWIINQDTNLSYGRSSFKDLLVGADDSIIAVGSAANADNYDVVALYKYNSDGSRDTNFGTDGATFSDHLYTTTTGGIIFDKGSEFVIGGMLQSDGKIVLAEQIWIGTNLYNKDPDFGVARFNSDGTIDTTFGTDGTGYGSGVDGVYAKASALQADDKILIVGSGMVGTEWRVAVTRFTADGKPDTSFGTTNNGTVLTNIIGANAFAVSTQTDKKILVAGDATAICQDTNSSYSSGLLLRYDENGTLDNSFSGDGIATFNISSIYDANPRDLSKSYACAPSSIKSISVESDGKILVMGKGVNSHISFYLARFNSDGTLDTSFGYQGAVAIYNYYDYATYNHLNTQFTGNNNNMNVESMKILNDGSIMLSGKYYSYHRSSYLYFMALHFNSDGSFDRNYGNNGIAIADVVYPKNSDYWDANAMSIGEQSNGKILLGGANYLFQWHQPTEATLIRIPAVSN